MVSADISHRCLRLAAVVAFAAFAASTSAQEQPPPPPIRVLILYGHDPNAPGVVAFTDGLREVLRIEGPERVELYSEVLDLDRFPDRIVNVHPALLPRFPGTHPIDDALAAGVPETGATVHYVDGGIDTGPVIRQEAVPVEPGDTVETLRARIQRVEHRLLPAVVRELLA